MLLVSGVIHVRSRLRQVSSTEVLLSDVSMPSQSDIDALERICLRVHD